MQRSRRVDARGADFAYCVTTWDDETGDAERVEYDEHGRPIRRAVVTRFPRERWEDDVVGEAAWFDADDRLVRRSPVLLGRSLLLGFHLNNNAAYRFALGDAAGAEAPLYEAAEIVPRDGGQWHWCLLQNAAELMAVRGAYDVAALLLGFTDKSFESWIDGRQATEEMQRNRLAALLEGALPRAEYRRLLEQGRALSLFEADHLAGFIKDERPRLRV